MISLVSLLGAVWFLAYAPLHEAPPAAIDSLLADARWRALSREDKLAALTRLRIGTPYELGCLGEEEPPDADPIFRLDRADCTVFVLTNAALLHAGNLDEARGAMVDLHYREGRASYERRYHFTTDRILSSPYFEEITAEVAPDTLLRAVAVVLNRTATGKELLPLSWERAVVVRYLPADLLADGILSRLPSACGVAFVKEENVGSGFLVSHEGVLLGGLTLVHASSQAGEVVAVPLREYVRRGGGGPACDGILFYRFR